MVVEKKQCYTVKNGGRNLSPQNKAQKREQKAHMKPGEAG